MAVVAFPGLTRSARGAADDFRFDAMTPPRLLHVLGGGPWQLPTVRLAQRLGYRVLVSDRSRSCPAYEVADFHEVADITDADATLRAARRHRIDGVICDTTDTGVRTAAWVAERLGLPGIGHEVALNFTSKARMRALASAARVKVPMHAVATDRDACRRIAEALGMPVVVKPVDAQSGCGVSRAARGEEVGPAFDAALGHSRDGTILVEQWVAGEEVIVDSFVVDGRVTMLGFARKTPYPDNPSVASRITYAVAGAGALLRRVEEVNRTVIRALGLRDGVTHAEYIVDDDSVVPIDVAARGGGVNIYTHVLPHLTGSDVNAAMIRFAMGEPVDVGEVSPERAANVEFFRVPQGTVETVDGVEAARTAPGVATLHLRSRPGDRVGPMTKKDDRAGHIVTTGESEDQVVRSGVHAKSLIRVRMSGVDDAQNVI